MNHHNFKKLQFGEYLSISISSSYELETQLLICKQRKYGNQEQLEPILKRIGKNSKNDIFFSDKSLKS